MRKYRLFFLTMIIGSLFVNNGYADEIEKACTIEKPKVEALGAVLIDAKTGRVLWGKNENDPLANASTTKIMTAILTLEKGNLNDIVKISKKAAAAPKVKMSLSAGEEIKLEYLLYALMLQSSNDAAVAIAEHIGGDVDNFCKLMTEKAKEIGAKDTVFETPNGLDKGEHHSTAYDMALIAKYALSLDKFIEITNTPSLTASSNSREYEIRNKNRLLKEFDGANGIKTGFTGKAGHCFVGAAKRDDMQLISVALGSGWNDKGKEQKWIDTKEMLNYGFNNYKYETILEKDSELAGYMQIERSKKDSLKLFFEEGLILPINKEEKKNIRMELDMPKSLKAPVQTNDKVGTAKIYIGEEMIKEVSILTADGADRHDFKTSLEKVINNWLELGTAEKVNTILPEFQ